MDITELKSLIETLPTDQKESVLKAVQYNYFNYIKPLNKFYRSSDLRKANKDILEIQKKEHELVNIKIESTLIKSFLNSNHSLKLILDKKNLSREEKQRIKLELIAPHDYVRHSAFILSLLQKSQNEVAFKWFVGVSISIFGLMFALFKILACE